MFTPEIMISWKIQILFSGKWESYDHWHTLSWGVLCVEEG